MFGIARISPEPMATPEKKPELLSEADGNWEIIDAFLEKISVTLSLFLPDFVPVPVPVPIRITCPSPSVPFVVPFTGPWSPGGESTSCRPCCNGSAEEERGCDDLPGSERCSTIKKKMSAVCSIFSFRYVYSQIDW